MAAFGERVVRLVRSLPVSAEAAIVVLTAFGLPLVRSFWMLVQPPTLPPLDNAHLAALIVSEPILLGLLTAFLWSRGWSATRLGLVRPRWVDIPLAVGLGLLCQVLYLGSYWLCWYTAPDIVRLVHRRAIVVAHLSW